jgi:hypothetical protein
MDASQLNQVRVNVTGEISDPTYAVWVNGVQGTNTGGGYWSATNVPVTAGGTASFDMTGYPPGFAPSGGSWTNFAIEQTAYPNDLPADPTQSHVDWDKPPAVYVKHMKYNYSSFETSYYDTASTFVDEWDWTQGGGGYRNETGNATNYNSDGSVNYINTDLYTVNWLADAGYLPVLPGMENNNGTIGSNTPNMEWIDMAKTGGVNGLGGDIVPYTWAFQAAQVVELFTGGKAVRRDRSLFVLSQTLYREIFSMDTFSGFGWLMDAIPSQQIVLGAYGNQGADGKLYVVMSKGQNVVISQKTTKQWVGGELPGAPEYPLTITASTNGSAVDLSTTTPGFCVGQDVAFFVSGLPTDGSVIATNFQWTLDGTFVNKDIPAANTNSSDIYTNDTTLLKNQTITNCWWTSGGYSPPTYQASVTCDLIFTNGNPKQSVNASGLFTMHRPQIYFSRTIPPGAIVTNVTLLTRPQFALEAFIHSAFDGEAGTTQLASGYSTNAVGGDNTTNTWELDNYEFYLYSTMPVYAGANANDTNSPYNNLTVMADDPSISCSNNTVIHKDFKDFIRFQPTGGNSIFVTLGTLNWHIYASASLSNSVYFLTSTPNGNADTNVIDSIDFPQWTNTLHNQ